LSSASLSFYRVIGLCIFASAIVEQILSGTLFLSYLFTLFSLSAILANSTDFVSMLPKAFLIISFYFEVILLVGIHINAFKNETIGNFIVVAPMIFFGLIAYFRLSRSSGARSYSLAIFTGPTIFISFLVFAYIRFEGVLTWAMSGDSRNHIYQIRAVIDRGGIILFNGYPAVANGFAALLGGWQYDSTSAGSGQLGSEVQILGLTSALILVICSIFSGLFIKTEIGTNRGATAVAVATISLIPFSQFFLNTYFVEGFFPSSFCLAVLLAVVFEMTRDHSTNISKVASCIMGSSLILLTFPLLLPLLLPCFAFAFLLNLYSKSVETFWNTRLTKRIWPLTFLFLSVLLAEIVYRIPTVSRYLFVHLNTYGRISQIDNRGLWLLALTAGLASVLATRSTRFLSLLTFFIGVFSIQFSIILDKILETDYYVSKYIWMSSTLMIILNLIIFVSLLLAVTSNLKRVVLGLTLLSLLTLTSLPLLQDFPLKPNLLTLATSPKYPSVEDAHLIKKINNIAPRSIFWGVSPDFEAKQVIEIWMALGFDFDRGAFNWGYKSDVFSLTAVCNFADVNQPATIWVVSREVKSLVKTICAVEGVTVEIIPTRK